MSSSPSCPLILLRDDIISPCEPPAIPPLPLSSFLVAAEKRGFDGPEAGFCRSTSSVSVVSDDSPALSLLDAVLPSLSCSFSGFAAVVARLPLGRRDVVLRLSSSLSRSRAKYVWGEGRSPRLRSGGSGGGSESWSDERPWGGEGR